MSKTGANPTSIKQAIQSLGTEQIAIVKGIVTKILPLSVQVLNNPKMVLTGNNLMCSSNLTNYTTTLDIEAGSLSSETFSDGGHSHSGGDHSHSGGTHNHKLSKFEIKNAKVTIHNQLKIGEIVILLRIANGKQYYILDRVVD